jgi:hypothetical protein
MRFYFPPGPDSSLEPHQLKKVDENTQSFLIRSSSPTPCKRQNDTHDVFKTPPCTSLQFDF